MAWLDTSGMRALAQSLRDTRETLVPVGGSHGQTVGGLHSSAARTAWGAALSNLDAASLTLAAEVDFLQAGADAAADAWDAAETHNQAELQIQGQTAVPR
jgi:hypothetical protein